MNIQRYETLFSIRYAVRLHERGTAYWGWIANLFKLLSVLSGSAALVSVVGNQSTMAVALGLAFALFQAFEITFSPTDRKYQEIVQRKAFANLYAKQGKYSDDDLEAAYRELVAEDESTPLNSIKELAYNDVVNEQGSDSSYCYQNGHFLVAMLS